MHTKKQESLTHSKEHNKSMENTLEKTKILELLDKDFKATVLKMFKELKDDMDKDGKCMNKMIVSVKG